MCEPCEEQLAIERERNRLAEVLIAAQAALLRNYEVQLLEYSLAS